MEINKINNLLNQDSLSIQLEQTNVTPYSFGLIKSNFAINQKDNFLANYKMVFMLEGNAQIIIDDNIYNLNQNDIIVIPPFVRHQLISNKIKITHYFIHFDTENNNIINNHLNIYRNIIDDFDINLLNKIYDISSNHQLGYYYVIKNMLLWFFFKLTQNDIYVETSKTKVLNTSYTTIVNNTITYINDNIHDNIKINDICDYLNISQSYLYQCFNAIFKISTKEFINTYKLHQIELDITKSNKTINQIANDYGYSNVYTFSNLFKKYYGISPLKYRQNSLSLTLKPNDTDNNIPYREVPYGSNS